jgi:hypothetical protein
VAADITFALDASAVLVTAPHDLMTSVGYALISANTLLERCVVELAKISEHLFERSGLCLVRIDPIFVAEYHTGKAGLRSGAVGAGSRTRQARPTLDGFAVSISPEISSKRTGRRFPCRLKPDSPRAAKTYEPPALR